MFNLVTKMKKFFYFCLVIAGNYLFVFCENNALPDFEMVTFNKTMDNCDNGICIDIHLKYYQITSPNQVAVVFNPFMENKVFSKMTYSDDHPRTKEEIIELVVRDYKAFRLEYPDVVSGGFMQNTESAITFKNNRFISIMVGTEIYSGGAHGNHFREFITINPSTGSEINLYDKLTNRKEFAQLVEIILREKLGMSPVDKWQDYTLVDEFTLPANAGLTDEGIMLVYNEYEILPYADGITEIVIPYNDLEPFLKID
jgi:hypothetical protein